MPIDQLPGSAIIDGTVDAVELTAAVNNKANNAYNQANAAYAAANTGGGFNPFLLAGL